jgi:lytic murein transglycosylase
MMPIRLDRLLFGLALVALVAFATAGARATDRADTERLFADWLKRDLWPQARSAGISAATFNEALAGVRLNWNLPDLVMPGAAEETPRHQRQAEFGSPGNYFAEKSLAAIAAGGRLLGQRHARTLEAIEREYGVPGHVILAIWGRESGFGRADIPHDAFEVLATKAFMATRKAMFRDELIAALRMVESGLARRQDMKSSWAGALGQPQFLPSSYLEHAVDFDRDGRADIWNSVPDTLASIASYLRHSGWIRSRDWGFEVVVPDSVSCALEGPDRGRPIRQWAELGIRRVSGRPFPDHEAGQVGFLLMPAGRFGPAFIVTPNFYVLKEYNESDLYALFIGHGADRIAYGARPFTAPWGEVGRLYRSDIAAMQRSLEARGHDVGGADGLPGFKTRRSIGEWQAASGRAPTCFPDAGIIGAVR